MSEEAVPLNKLMANYAVAENRQLYEWAVLRSVSGDRPFIRKEVVQGITANVLHYVDSDGVDREEAFERCEVDENNEFEPFSMMMPAEVADIIRKHWREKFSCYEIILPDPNQEEPSPIGCESKYEARRLQYVADLLDQRDQRIRELESAIANLALERKS